MRHQQIKTATSLTDEQYVSCDPETETTQQVLQRDDIHITISHCLFRRLP